MSNGVLDRKAKLRMLIELEYDPQTMHSGDADKESKRWFMENVLLNKTEEGRLILHSNELGDELGTVNVLEVHPF